MGIQFIFRNLWRDGYRGFYTPCIVLERYDESFSLCLLVGSVEVGFNIWWSIF